MTKKQEQIIQATIQLFNDSGYHGTSTNSIARSAGVSEGLIFRHFNNKEGLLIAIKSEIETQLSELFFPVLDEQDPKETIKQTLELPFNATVRQYQLWKLEQKLSWELDLKTNIPAVTLEHVLTHAFEKLRYRQPKLESSYLLQLLDGILAAKLQDRIENEEQFKAFLMNKYHIES